MQQWVKLDVRFNVDHKYEWAQTHAMMPCVLQQDEDNFLIFFSPRDQHNQSRPASIKLNMQTKTFTEFSPKPLLELGDLGAFDDSGVMPTSLVKQGNQLYMYYNGWTLGKKIPFWSFNSVAVSRDNGATFEKLSKSPLVLFRDDIDPYSTFAPFVLCDNGLWQMWYVSCTKWTYEQGKPKHYYHIKHATSRDGIRWKRNGKVCIDFSSEYEYAIARPMVMKEDGIYKMWYSYRATAHVDTYRIGYAESDNGVDWQRMDNEVMLEPSASGWDSDMLCYAYVFDHHKERYMLYNGNGYGKTGVGLAILQN